MLYSSSVINNYVNALFFTMNKYGITKQQFINSLPIALTEDSIIDINILMLMWQSAIFLIKDESLGFYIGQQLQLNTYDLVGNMVMCSENVKAAMDLAVRYSSLVSEGGKLSLHEKEESFFLHFLPKEPMNSYFVECVLTGLVKFASYVLPLTSLPIKIDFVHPPPQNIKIYEDFFQCKVNFNAEEYGIYFNKNVINEKISSADPSLLIHYQDIAEKKIYSLHGLESWHHKVKNSIEILSDWNNITSCSIALKQKVSVRKMQRHLSLEKTSYKEILDQARKEKAKILLEKSQLNIQEISTILGYREHTSFHRAFKRWYGITPNKLMNQSI